MNSIKTGIRIRGAVDGEHKFQEVVTVSSSAPNSVDVRAGDGTQTFTFDFVLGPEATQQDVFAQIGASVLNDGSLLPQ